MLHFRIQRTKDMANQGTIRTSLGQQNWGWRCRKQRNKVKRTPPEQKKIVLVYRFLFCLTKAIMSIRKLNFQKVPPNCVFWFFTVYVIKECVGNVRISIPVIISKIILSEHIYSKQSLEHFNIFIALIITPVLWDKHCFAVLSLADEVICKLWTDFLASHWRFISINLS